MARRSLREVLVVRSAGTPERARRTRVDVEKSARLERIQHFAEVAELAGLVGGRL